ncbi:hypothetical protein QRO08_07010 [Paracidovorax citrulli]|uniref:Transglycosylase SLT domain-containing protein n=2 Tax=Paracidovorax citrulli TaxID=80869 RepID=A1TSU0_PARC0|nr:hypothetical protein [Paracidovorax citrulli]ABM34028.1 conserved hypothetical protein [Paracidovorax citrulli AAC00-1]ATG93551.1 hypothetical protein CQB05_05445 [Paracidovorax citrulli]MVT27842.1 hypothetical protein [Paracidovorax citrulli]PVY63467.1 hypothetical protein C8E08_0753 [Paracidovorax citrulli]REG67566.1 hypothetical protein C8E07_0636 [Paracidovorax citrulli]
MGDAVCNVSNGSPGWGVIDLFAWKLVPARWGGGRAYIQKFKDAWVRHNKQLIVNESKKYQLPPELLAGVCWIEVGGDPSFIDRVAFEIRSFDWSGPPWTDKQAITNHPNKTSFGAVSIQIRAAAETLGLNPSELTSSQARGLAECLQKDVFNIEVVARHLSQLAAHDGFSAPLGQEEVRIIGARYNRGVGLTLEQIRKNTSYGNFLVKFWNRFSQLIQ